MTKPDTIGGAQMRVSNLTFHEMMTLFNQLNSRIDALWQRVVYFHAGIVGVMIFFGASADLYPLQRLLVFGFYSANVIITLSNFHEAYGGLKAVASDLTDFPQTDRPGAVLTWAQKQRFGWRSPTRIAVLGSVWAIITYLLVRPLI